MMPSLQRLRVLPVQKNNFTQATSNQQTDLQSPFNPGYTPLQQSLINSRTPQYAAYNASLQQPYYDQQQLQVGVPMHSLQYLANPPKAPAWQPAYNPADFTGPTKWSAPNGPITRPPQIQPGQKVSMNPGPSTIHRLLGAIKGIL